MTRVAGCHSVSHHIYLGDIVLLDGTVLLGDTVLLIIFTWVMPCCCSSFFCFLCCDLRFVFALFFCLLLFVCLFLFVVVFLLPFLSNVVCVSRLSFLEFRFGFP